MSIDAMSRYPFGIDRMRYNKIVGALRVNNVVRIITRFGFHVVYEEVENKDVDIWVFDADQTLVLVSEVTNWRPSSAMSAKKGRSVQDNFRSYECNKLFICSFMKNLRHREEYFECDVDLVEFEFQTQPVPWYEWFLKQGRATGMKPFTEDTMKGVYKVLLNYFLEKELIFPSFFK